MSRVIQIQTNFSAGEVDPLLRARIDLQQYYNALETAENVFCLPQGGIKRRDGLKFIFKLPTAASPQSGVALIPFEFSTDDTYMLCVTAGRIYVFRNGTLVTGINGGSDDFITASAITGAMLDKLRFAQSADTIILVHEDLAPQKIVRGASHSLWTISALTFTNAPRHAFALNTTNPPESITPSASSDSITLTASGNIFHDGQTGTASSGSANSIVLDSGSSSSDIYNGSRIRITSGTGAGQARVIADYTASSRTVLVTENWSTQPSSDSVFSIDSMVGQYVNLTNFYGRLRILNVQSETKVDCFAEVALFDTTAVPANEYEIEQGYEEAWSADRGYPKSITFHEGRLWFAGSKSMPTTFWASTANNFFDFDLGESLDDQSIIGSITTDSLNSITDIHSGRDLQIFTTSAEFFFSQSEQQPITPSNVTVQVGTRNGSKPGVPVAGLDSGTMYVQRLGKSLNEMVFTDSELSYTTSAISLLSGHLLKTPIDMAIRRATSTEEADRLFIVNSGDGSIACYSLLRSQQVVAPTVLKTAGTFEAVGVDLDTVYVVCKRTIPAQATCTITVSDSSAIQAGDTITFSDNAGTQVTLTATTDDPPTGETATALGFSMGGSPSNNTVADEISVGHGSAAGINSLAAFSAPNPTGNVITVTRTAVGNDNLTVTSSRPSAIAVTNFSGGENDVYYVEAFDSTLHTDSAVFSESAASTGGAGHLEHHVVDVVVDGTVQNQKTVPSGGTISFDRASTENFEIGLPFTMTAKTMPCETRLSSGNIRAFKKRILEVSADLFESQVMTINGQIVPFRSLGTNVLDSVVPKFTGVKTIGPLLGYDQDGAITVTQDKPLDLTILALSFMVSVGQ